MRSKFCPHVMQVDAVVLRLGWTHVAVASEERTCAHGGGRLATFVERKVQLIPSVFDTGNLVAVH